MSRHPNAHPSPDMIEVQARFEALRAEWWSAIRHHIDEVVRDNGEGLRRMVDYHLDTGGK
ncbi:MAG: hypothetical protein GY953_06955, partial [bacterium]|nr:hypothetical protein [bacterium]